MRLIFTAPLKETTTTKAVASTKTDPSALAPNIFTLLSVAWRFGFSKSCAKEKKIALELDHAKGIVSP